MTDLIKDADELANAIDDERNMVCQDFGTQQDAAFRVDEALTAYRKSRESAGEVKVRPLVFKDTSGEAMLGPHTSFDAETPIGRVCYGTDTDGIHWYSYPSMKENVVSVSASSLDKAKQAAVRGYERELLEHPVISAIVKERE